MLLVVVVAVFMAIGGFGIVYLAGAFDMLAREVEALEGRLVRLEGQAAKKPGNVNSRECASAKTQ
jgi:hypothetical protein